MEKIMIGALGGSGTIAIAEVLMKCGVYMGDYLNDANDNLVFTRLFRNKKWYRNKKNENSFKARLKIFQKYMNGEKLTTQEKLELIKAGLNEFNIKQNIKFSVFILFKYKQSFPPRDSWGAKEPNTQIYLEDLTRNIPNLKYIHVVRHGLDMAFSNNKLQLENWGWKYGINVNSSDKISDINKKQLDYWIKTTEEVYKIQDANIYILNHTQFCEKPELEIKKLLEFLNISVSKNIFDELITIPKITSSNDRYKNESLSIFSQDQLSRVKALGFHITNK